MSRPAGTGHRRDQPDGRRRRSAGTGFRPAFGDASRPRRLRLPEERRTRCRLQGGGVGAQRPPQAGPTMGQPAAAARPKPPGGTGGRPQSQAHEVEDDPRPGRRHAPEQLQGPLAGCRDVRLLRGQDPAGMGRPGFHLRRLRDRQLLESRPAGPIHPRGLPPRPRPGQAQGAGRRRRIEGDRRRREERGHPAEHPHAGSRLRERRIPPLHGGGARSADPGDGRRVPAHRHAGIPVAPDRDRGRPRQDPHQRGARPGLVAGHAARGWHRRRGRR
mmetsp:Transcript_19872/g.46568  ORF Transcript_19872/g.46568 Transcript_19872/m.46568 type:complete len:273 (+) Transcript_19872:1136-1954(+)